jgi:hypothetical protein
MDKETAPVNIPPANNAQDALANKTEDKPAIKQKEFSPSKPFMLICGIIAGILLYPLIFFLLSIRIPIASYPFGLFIVVGLALIVLFSFVKNKQFLWGTMLGLFLPILLVFGSCFIHF